MEKSIKEQFIEMMNERFNINVTIAIRDEFIPRYQSASAGNEFQLIYPSQEHDFVLVEVETEDDRPNALFILTFLIDSDRETMRMISFTEVKEEDKLNDIDTERAIGGKPNLCPVETDKEYDRNSSFLFSRLDKYPVNNCGIGSLCFNIYKEGEYTHSVCIITQIAGGEAIANGWVFNNKALVLLDQRKEEEKKLIISSIDELTPFISGDMDAPEDKVVYRVEGADGIGMYHSSQAGGIHLQFEIPLPGYKLISLSKEGYLFAFHSLAELWECTHGLSAKHFNLGARIKRIKYKEIVHGNSQCVVRV